MRSSNSKRQRSLDPHQADIHYTLGVTLWQQGEFDEAANELQAAIQAKPDYAEAHYTLGTVLKQQGKLQEAAASLREAIRLQPDFAGAHTTLAAILQAIGRYRRRRPGKTSGRANQQGQNQSASSNVRYQLRKEASRSWRS